MRKSWIRDSGATEKMRKFLQFLRRSYRTVRDAELVNILQSELRHEQNSNPYQWHKSGSLGDFVLDWDQRRYKDVVLRRSCDSGEEIAVSALLGGEDDDDGTEGFPYRVLMKVCVKKPGLSSVLQFDCVSSEAVDGKSDFSVCNAYYLPSSRALGVSVYRGPSFRSLDPHLQDAFKEYLVARGIGEELFNFLLLHLHRKENDQYVRWLSKIEDMLLKNGQLVRQKIQ